jgi:osmotically inducible protein OsmC
MAEFTRSAVLEWKGDVIRGSGGVSAVSGAFAVRASFPRVIGEPEGVTTPEELLAASHAACFGIGLRSVIGRRGGTARRVSVVATVTAEKGASGIRIRSAHLSGVVEGLEGVTSEELEDIARETADGCTISEALWGNVVITHEVAAVAVG